MINQLLDDPKLTARKYREWKVMNTLLIQDIYQQQRLSTSAPEDTTQEHEEPHSSACVESSIWEQTLITYSKQLFRNVTYPLQRKTETLLFFKLHSSSNKAS